VEVTQGEVSGSDGNVALCSLIETDRRFRGAYCFHHEGNSSVSFCRLTRHSIPGDIFRTDAICFARFVAHTVFCGAKIVLMDVNNTGEYKSTVVAVCFTFQLFT
jgi:hypothetical protein